MPNVPPDHLSELVEKALALSEEERNAFVASLNDEDARLGEYVQERLEEIAEANQYFEDFEAELGIGSSLAQAGRFKVGAYEVIELVGRGGMGVVYRARRKVQDARADFEQEVALKLIRSEGLDEAAIKRFLNERQILASLSHPNIARLFDGGVTLSGAPYLVMEWVDGVPITAYCDEQRLDIDARLALFGQVVQAVQHAHTRLTVHRDLKPSNILVDTNGTVKLLDFGIAKVLTEDHHEAQLTSPVDRFLTPAYATPELLSGEPVTTLSDVYQLGLLLYELLTGHRAHRTGSTHAESVDFILNVDPTRPSSVVAAPPVRRDPESISTEIFENRSIRQDALKRRLRGDLDHIVQQALRKDPSLRYSSAESLLEDVRNHLALRPVNARPPSLAYRLRRYALRHKAGTAIAALVVAYAATASLQSRSNAMERDRALEALDRADAVSQFMVGVFESSDPIENESGQLKVDELLERGARKIDDELSGHPEIRAATSGLMGQIYTGIGRNERALPLFQRSFDILKQLHYEQHPDVLRAQLKVAAALARESRFELADSLLQDATPKLVKAGLNRSTAYLEALTEVTFVSHRPGNYDDAKSAYRSIIAAARESRETKEETYLNALVRLGKLEGFTKNRNVSDRDFREALDLAIDLFGRDHQKVAEVQEHWMDALTIQLDFAAALPKALDALRIRQLEFENSHDFVQTAELALLSILRKKGDLVRADSVGTRLLERLVPESGPRFLELTMTLGFVRLDAGRYLEAETLFRQAMSLSDDTSGPFLASQYGNIGVALLGQKRDSEGIAVLRTAIATIDTSKNAQFAQHLKALYLREIASTFSRQGDFSAADDAFVEAMAAYPVQETPSLHNGTQFASLGDHLQRQGKTEEANEYFTRALAVAERYNSQRLRSKLPIEFQELDADAKPDE